MRAAWLLVLTATARAASKRRRIARGGALPPAWLLKGGAEATKAHNLKTKADAAQRADQLKDDANRSLHEDRPQEALSLYTKAIGIQPSAVLYANRAAAQMRIGRLQKAIDDANEALNKPSNDERHRPPRSH